MFTVVARGIREWYPNPSGIWQEEIFKDPYDFLSAFWAESYTNINALTNLRTVFSDVPAHLIDTITLSEFQSLEKSKSIFTRSFLHTHVACLKEEQMDGTYDVQWDMLLQRLVDENGYELRDETIQKLLRLHLAVELARTTGKWFDSYEWAYAQRTCSCITLQEHPYCLCVKRRVGQFFTIVRKLQNQQDVHLQTWKGLNVLPNVMYKIVCQYVFPRWIMKLRSG